MSIPLGAPRAVSLDEAVETAVQWHQAGRLDEAKSIYDQILAQVEHPQTLALRGLIAHQQNDSETAVKLLERAIALEPGNAMALTNLGSVLLSLQRHDEAISRLEEAARMSPDFVEARVNLANAYVAAGRHGDAAPHYEHALALNPGHPQAMLNYAALHADLGQFTAAINLLHRLTKLDPQNAEAYNNLGALFGRIDKWEDAKRCYERAIALKPDYAEALSNLGALYVEMGQKDKARSYFDKAPQVAPNYHQADSNRLFLMHYEEQWTQEQLLAEAKAWAAKHAPASLRLPPAPAKPPAGRKLRVGYVSPDFRMHPVGFFMESVLAAHAASGACEVFCYTDTAMEDDVTQRLRRHNHWRRIYGQPDAKAAQMIREDGIDVLVDLAGHTANNRLVLFGMKPAPVQITWLGYFDTTGMAQMDYILCDEVMLPPENERWFVEKPLRLPECYLCYTPQPLVVAVSPPPSLKNGHVTFGCFNKLNKISVDTFRAWSEILKRTPGARLFLKNYWLTDAPIRQATIENFTKHGVGEERLVLEGFSPHAEYFAAYNRVDIALDPLLYSGGTTTAEALWMSTPVVTLPGERFVSRICASLLKHGGGGELVARDYGHYIETACSLARDAARLQGYKATLRERFTASPVCDAGRFVTRLEGAFLQAFEARQ
jgi:predicted O-linked N-acetylglucosamine transferase (SPINDLY family)